MYVIKYSGIDENGNPFHGQLKTKSSRFSKILVLIDADTPVNLRTVQKLDVKKEKEK